MVERNAILPSSDTSMSKCSAAEDKSNKDIVQQPAHIIEEKPAEETGMKNGLIIQEMEQRAQSQQGMCLRFR